ncbi:hypothetical protein JCM3770_002603 [Rhodotorula araucariae]
MICTPPSLSLPAGSVFIEDVDEEIFLLYTRKLQIASVGADSGADVSDSALGYLSGKDGVLPVSLTITNPEQRGRADTHTSFSKARRAEAGKERGPKEDEVVVDVVVHQALDALRHRKGDTGSVLWRVSLYLARYLLQSHHFPSPSHPPLLPSLRTSTVLELGSGTGFLGIALRSIWGESGRWIFTDQLANLPLVVRNLRANALLPPDPHGSATGKRGAPSPRPPPPNVDVVELDWLAEAAAWDHCPGSVYASASPSPSLSGVPPLASSSTSAAPLPTPPDVLLAADCIYNPSLATPLAKTLLRRAGARTLVVVAAELRDDEPLAEFLGAWTALGAEAGWKCARVGWGDGEDSARAGRIAQDGCFALWISWREESVV